MVDMLTEDEQLVALKVWWRRYGWYVIGGVVAGLAIYFVWSTWQNKQFEQRATASFHYQSLLEQQFDNNAKASVVSSAESSAVLPAPYAYMENLLAAEVSINQAKLADAIADLQQVMQSTDDPFIKELATLRLARVYLADGKSQLALDLLPASNEHVVDRAEWAITRAKALTELEKFDEARGVYGEVMVLYPEYSPQREMASRLLADLPAE